MTAERASASAITALPCSGAEQLARALRRGGVDRCFANPGTTEVELLGALEAQPELQVLLCLFEGVATGAADGFGRMAGRPAATLLHCGPGLANGLANLHNARRARSPIVNLVGDHPSWHAAMDPPLASDLEGLARPVSDWVRRVSSAETIASDGREAVRAAGGAPGRVATLVVPADCQWGRTPDASAPATSASRPASAAARAIEEPRLRRVARALERHGARAVLLLGGGALGGEALQSAARIAAKTGALLVCTSFPARLEQGGGLPRVERLPYLAEAADAMFADAELVVLAGAAPPVCYFADASGRTRLLPGHLGVEALVEPDEDRGGALEEALAQLADRLGAPPFQRGHAPPPQPPRAALSGHTLALTLAAALPEQAIVVDEGVSIAGAFLRVCEGAPRHSYLALTGGACGQGLPLALGAAVACPERKVIALVGDGSAMYTVQALWTHAQHALDVVTIVYANDGYRILEAELSRRTGAASRALAFGERSLDWVALAQGFGVAARRATTGVELTVALDEAMASRGPRLIEVRATPPRPR